MKLKIWLHLLLLTLFISCSTDTPTTLIQNEGIKLKPLEDKIYLGAFLDFGSTEDNVTTTHITKFEGLIERKLAWASFSQNWYKGLSYPQKEIDTISEEGVTPYIRFMPRSDHSLISRKDENISLKKDPFSLERIVAGQFDEELRLWAQDAKGDGTPLIIDFAMEMNGDWFSWSGAYNGKGSKNLYGNPNYYDGAELYRDAYRHIIDIFRDEKVNHVTWFFHPNITSASNEEWNKPKYYYPGDDYIDWIGISLYGVTSVADTQWKSFNETLEPHYKSILEISSRKPYALLEFGVTDGNPLGDKSLWLSEAFETILSKKYIHFQAINYWHENWGDPYGGVATLRIDSSAESLETFKSYIENPCFISDGVFGSN